ncbi:hypothetical protein RHGRI_018982 [Rhododendron griersonianum]|uniref:Uncharacterized protein n=1 Tax=Rhododendron griersonianum TaxID=479676 RepID=A0AAV6JCZ6_9ERIC|nr:hypothetical protein RHGRI_018982 [Rhododendron griersonianum]
MTTTLISATDLVSFDGGGGRSTGAMLEVSHLGWGWWYTLRELEKATNGQFKPDDAPILEEQLAISLGVSASLSSAFVAIRLHRPNSHIIKKEGCAVWQANHGLCILACFLFHQSFWLERCLFEAVLDSRGR